MTEAQSLYRHGFVVIRRESRPGRGSPGPGWTLHVATCPYVKRATAVINAPVVPYSDTKVCQFCKPSLEITDRKEMTDVN